MEPSKDTNELHEGMVMGHLHRTRRTRLLLLFVIALPSLFILSLTSCGYFEFSIHSPRAHPKEIDGLPFQETSPDTSISHVPRALVSSELERRDDVQTYAPPLWDINEQARKNATG